MPSHKLLVVCATLLASASLPGIARADGPSSKAAPSLTGSSSSAPMTASTPTTAQTPATPPTSSSTTLTGAEVLPTSPNAPMTFVNEPTRDLTLYQKRTPNKAILVTGGALLVGTYAVTAALAATNGPVADKDLYIPVIGPWINIAERGDSRSNQTRDIVLVAGSGILQGIGALMAVSSFLIPEKVAAARIQAGPVELHIAPTAGPGAGGLGAVGTF